MVQISKTEIDLYQQLKAVMLMVSPFVPKWWCSFVFVFLPVQMVLLTGWFASLFLPSLLLMMWSNSHIPATIPLDCVGSCSEIFRIFFFLIVHDSGHFLCVESNRM